MIEKIVSFYLVYNMLNPSKCPEDRAVILKRPRTTSLKSDRATLSTCQIGTRHPRRPHPQYDLPQPIISLQRNNADYGSYKYTYQAVLSIIIDSPWIIRHLMFMRLGEFPIYNAVTLGLHSDNNILNLRNVNYLLVDFFLLFVERSNV